MHKTIKLWRLRISLGVISGFGIGLGGGLDFTSQPAFVLNGILGPVEFQADFDLGR